MTKLETTLEVLLALLVGFLFLGAGLAGAGYQLVHPPPGGVDRRVMGMFIGLAVVGALILPSIFTALFPRVKSLVVLVFPNGIPWPGGRRIGDPPLPTAPAPAEPQFPQPPPPPPGSPL